MIISYTVFNCAEVRSGLPQFPGIWSGFRGRLLRDGDAVHGTRSCGYEGGTKRGWLAEEEDV